MSFAVQSESVIYTLSPPRRARAFSSRGGNPSSALVRLLRDDRDLRAPRVILPILVIGVPGRGSWTALKSWWRLHSTADGFDSIVDFEARTGWKQPNRSYARSCARLQLFSRVQRAQGSARPRQPRSTVFAPALKAAESTERTIEMNFRLPDQWSRKLFLALCRRYGLKPFRYPRQRHSTVVLRAPGDIYPRDPVARVC